MSGNNSDSNCSCSSHCCCSRVGESERQCHVAVDKNSCGCDMDKNPLPDEVPLDIQLPDSRPGDSYSADIEADHKDFFEYVLIEVPISFLAPMKAGPPIYIAVTSLII